MLGAMDDSLDVPLTREEFELFKGTSKERRFQTAHDFQNLAIALCDSGRFDSSLPSGVLHTSVARQCATAA
jgi:hypothetical protein